MSYINTETMQYPINEQDIRYEYPNTSFTVPFVAPEKYAPVLNSPTPIVPNTVLQFAREVAPTKDSLGNWMQTYEVVDIYSEYTDPEGVVHTKEEQEAAAISKDEEEKKQRNKTQAESLLKESDWSDKPSVVDTSKALHLVNAAEWDTYRDALRRIAVVPTATVEWPTKPEELWSTTV